jgi:hypothetical protein
MNALAASAEADVLDRVEAMERERDRYRYTLELILRHADSFANIVGQDSKVSRRTATGAVEVMAGLIEDALGR